MTLKHETTLADDKMIIKGTWKRPKSKRAGVYIYVYMKEEPSGFG